MHVLTFGERKRAGCCFRALTGSSVSFHYFSCVYDVHLESSHADAIDNITTKVDLLAYCHANGLRVISSMGAGAKADPTRVQIADISSTIYDPLARSVRRRLRLQGVANGIPVVYSTEVPGEVKLLPLAEEEFQKGDIKELGVFDDFRVRILPVIGGLFGVL
jgi:tRNA A37 threonylcarbamoyladenosine dehydratase